MRDDNLLSSFGEHQIEKTEMEVLYHYTSIYSLQCIVENKKFWITRSDFLNDPGEIVYFGQLVQQTIDALKVTGSLNEDWLNALYHSYGTHFQVAYQPNYYILSLSKNRDSLAMWNYYGKNDGYCLGINFNKLIDAFKFNRFNILHGSLNYEPERQITILENELQLAYNYWLETHNSNENMIYTIVDTLFARWAMYTLFFKHSGYKQEEEYRVVFTHRSDFDVKYRTAHGVFTPYIEVPTTKIDSEDFPLESITVGPLIKHDRAERGLAEWCRKNGHYFNGPEQAIYPSTIPLRF